MATTSSASAFILVDSTAYVDKNNSNHNESTAEDYTSNGYLIQVSLWPAHPPMPSRLSVHCPSLLPDQGFFQEPSIICTADTFFILRIAIGRRRDSFPPQNITQKMCDYFVYRAAGSTGPSLRLLTNPHPHFFRDNEVGLLPRGDQFTIAVLSQTSYYNFMLHLFKSEHWDWSSKKVLVDPPQIHFPMPLADNRSRHFQHFTNSVITLGGEGGTIGWVDLWRGILFYDVFLDIGKIRFMPLPARLGSRQGFDCCLMPYRSIAIIGNCLKLIELEVSGDRLPGKDPETRGPKLRIDNWALTTYTYNITGDNWKIHPTVAASDIRIDTAMHSGLRRCGMLRKTENSEAAVHNLHNLWTCQPVLSLNDDGCIVYLITRVKFQHPKAWVLAVDMSNKQVQAVAVIETERSTSLSLAYFPSRISGYLNGTMPVTGGLRYLENQLQKPDRGIHGSSRRNLTGATKAVEDSG